MAVKRHKSHKGYFKASVRGPAVRLAPSVTPSAKAKPAKSENSASQPTDFSESLWERSAESDNHAARVMVVITLLGLAYIGFITWCIEKMPTR